MGKKQADMIMKATPEKGHAKTTNIVIIALLTALVVIGGVLVYTLVIKDNTDNKGNGNEREIVETAGGRGVVLTPENVQDFLEERDKTINDASYTCSMSIEWVFDKWDAPSSNVYVENYVDNTRTVYFDVYLDDENGDAIEDELIYSSPYLEVGAELNKFALQKQVSAGEYTATVIYYLVDDDYNVITDVSVGIRLIIRN